MVQVRVQHSLAPGEREQVTLFLEAARRRDGSRLNDHLTSDLTHGPRDGYLASIAFLPDGTVQGYAQASAANDGFIIGCVSSAEDGPTQAALLRALLAALPSDIAVTWWATGDERSLAAELGLSADRSLLRMGRPLPISETTDVIVRPFRIGHDEHAWLAVNNAAFAWHGEQGGWDLTTLRQRESEPWFDAEGFLLHERAGRLAAFCWTKLHPDEARLSGEIYVIAVHPDFHGHGLGRALTIAGLQHLQSVGATAAMLYVDAENTAAVGLYRALGFTIEHTDHSYQRPARGATP